MQSTYDASVVDRLNTFAAAARALRRNRDAVPLLGDVICRHGLNDILGIVLLHNHFAVRPGERLVRVHRGAAILSEPHAEADWDDQTAYLWKVDRIPADDGWAYFPIEYVRTDETGRRYRELAGRVFAHTAFLRDFMTTIVSIGVTDLLGISILWDGFRDLRDGELMIEGTDGESRVNDCEIVPADSLGDSVNVPTLWAFRPAQPGRTRPGEDPVFRRWIPAARGADPPRFETLTDSLAEDQPMGRTAAVEETNPATPIDPRRFVRNDHGRESLARLTLVQQLLDDPLIELAPRRVDRRWYYEGFVPVSLSGFHPATARIYYSGASAFADWLKDPHASARPTNEGDFLVNEVFFAVHDYLHAWACQVINEIRPEIQFGFGEITPRNAEAMAFCHLLTEAAAVIGLDYWYLSQFDLNSAVPIGTSFRHVSVSYDVKHLEEYRRFCPDLRVEHPGFVRFLGTFYCTGVFEGFSPQDLKDSPLLYTWLCHELVYGRRQREYTRLWLQHLSGHDLGYEAGQSLTRPVPCDEGWMRDLMDKLGDWLWSKVVEDRRTETPRTIPTGRAWQSPRPPRDFRFTNLAALSVREAGGVDPDAIGPESLDFLMFQYLSQYDYGSVPPAIRDRIPGTLACRDFGTLFRLLFRTERVLDIEDRATMDLMLVN